MIGGNRSNPTLWWQKQDMYIYMMTSLLAVVSVIHVPSCSIWCAFLWIKSDFFHLPLLLPDQIVKVPVTKLFEKSKLSPFWLSLSPPLPLSLPSLSPPYFPSASPSRRRATGHIDTSFLLPGLCFATEIRDVRRECHPPVISVAAMTDDAVVRKLGDTSTWHIMCTATRRNSEIRQSPPRIFAKFGKCSSEIPVASYASSSPTWPCFTPITSWYDGSCCTLCKTG